MRVLASLSEPQGLIEALSCAAQLLEEERNQALEHEALGGIDWIRQHLGGLMEDSGGTDRVAPEEVRDVVRACAVIAWVTPVASRQVQIDTISKQLADLHHHTTLIVAASASAAQGGVLRRRDPNLTKRFDAARGLCDGIEWGLQLYEHDVDERTLPGVSSYHAFESWLGGRGMVRDADLIGAAARLAQMMREPRLVAYLDQVVYATLSDQARNGLCTWAARTTIPTRAEDGPLTPSLEEFAATRPPARSFALLVGNHHTVSDQPVASS